MLLYLNSKSRISGNTNDAYYSISSGLFTLSNSKQKIKITLVDFLTKHNFYNIESYNNKLKVIENGIIRIIEIDYSSPNVYDFQNVLLNKLNESSLYTYAMTYDNSKLSFVYSAIPKAQTGTIQFIFENTETLYEQMGFYSNSTNDFIIEDNILTLSSTRIIDLGGEEAIYIHLQDLESNNIYNNSKSTILSRIPILVPSGSSIFYNNIESSFSLETKKEFSNLHIRITNENDRLIEMQSSYSLVLRIDIIDEDDTNLIDSLNKIKEYTRSLVLYSFKNSINKI